MRSADGHVREFLSGSSSGHGCLRSEQRFMEIRPNKDHTVAGAGVPNPGNDGGDGFGGVSGNEVPAGAP